MNNCNENKNAISYTPIYLNLFLSIIYFIFQYIKQKNTHKNLNIIKKKIESSCELEEKRQSNVLQLDKLIEILKEFDEIKSNSKKSIDEQIIKID